MGFTGPVRNGMIEQLGVELDARGNVKTENYQSVNQSQVFAAGDARAGSRWWSGRSPRAARPRRPSITA